MSKVDGPLVRHAGKEQKSMPEVSVHSSPHFGVEFPRPAAPFEKAATKNRGHRSGHRLLFPLNMLPSISMVLWLHLRARSGAAAWLVRLPSRYCSPLGRVLRSHPIDLIGWHAADSSTNLGTARPGRLNLAVHVRNFSPARCSCSASPWSLTPQSHEITRRGGMWTAQDFPLSCCCCCCCCFCVPSAGLP